MNEFAKTFQTDKGQILVLKQINDDGCPEVRVFAEPENLGVCSIAVSGNDNDAGWDAIDDLFERIDLDIALNMASKLFEMSDYMVD